MLAAIEWVQAKPHNVPALPSPLRGLAGQLLAGPLHAAEPLWSLAPWQWVGESFWAERRKAVKARQPAAADGTLMGAAGAAGLVGDDAFDASIDFATAPFKGLAFGAQRAADAAGAAAAAARARAAGAAYSAAAGAASKVTQATSEVASKAAGTAVSAASKAAGAASKAAGAAKGAAGSAYDTVAGAAGGAYETAAGAAGGAYDNARGATGVRAH
ncbi:MAG: hypothetical protein J3K34DRAFT_527899 [Monoraphidium minutum]|nr:MAG: hypothetical protein J3K34DRAFT_527899 [Monoraphidium minutum]